MASAQLNHVMQTVKVLSAEEKRALFVLLSKELQGAAPASEPDSENHIQFGWARGLITIAPDFDEPLEDFKEYRA